MKQRKQRKTSSVLRWARSVVHNTLIHPLMPFLPEKWGDYLHDVSGDWAFKKK